MERGHDMIFFCLDNEAYMNTGIQRSSATPFMAATTTSPAGKVIPGQRTWKKNMPEIMVAHNVPYVATACPSYPLDLIEQGEKGQGRQGPGLYPHLLHLPHRWRCPSESRSRWAVWPSKRAYFPSTKWKTGNTGSRWRVPGEASARRRIILKPQGRYRHLAPSDIEKIQEHVRASGKSFSTRSSACSPGNVHVMRRKQKTER